MNERIRVISPKYESGSDETMMIKFLDSHPNFSEKLGRMGGFYFLIFRAALKTEQGRKKLLIP